MKRKLTTRYQKQKNYFQLNSIISIAENVLVFSFS